MFLFLVLGEGPAEILQSSSSFVFYFTELEQMIFTSIAAGRAEEAIK